MYICCLVFSSAFKTFAFLPIPWFLNSKSLKLVSDQNRGAQQVLPPPPQIEPRMFNVNRGEKTPGVPILLRTRRADPNPHHRYLVRVLIPLQTRRAGPKSHHRSLGRVRISLRTRWAGPKSHVLSFGRVLIPLRTHRANPKSHHWSASES